MAQATVPPMGATPAQVPPHGGWVPAPPSPPRTGVPVWGVVLVIVAVVVAVLLILAVVLLTMVGGLVTDGPTRPAVSLTTEVLGATDVRIDVAGATPAEPLARFRATLFVNDSAAETIAPLADDNTGVLRFSDRDGGGRLTGGDRFIMTWVTPGRYELVLFWTDGSRIVGRAWTI